MGDETLRRVFVRSLEIIGEAAKKIPETFRVQYPEVQSEKAGTGCGIFEMN